jgi:hypothetical protein
VPEQKTLHLPPIILLMKKLLPLSALLAAPLFCPAQSGTSFDKAPETATKDSLNETPVSNIDWSAFVNRDYVSIGNLTYDVLSLEPGWIIQVRFYGAGMSPLINQQIDGGKPLAFTKSENSRVLAVQGQTDGSVKVFLATADRLGPFIENISLKSALYSYTFTIKGLVQDAAEREKEEKEQKKKKKKEKMREKE